MTTSPRRCGCARSARPPTRGRCLVAARGGADAATRRTPAPVPARAVGRHAAARHDRGRAHELASPAHLRRADHRARRDDAGRDPRRARRAAGESGHGHAVHHARPESRGHDLRSRLRHERGPGRGAGRRPAGVPQPAGGVHEAARRGDAHDRRRRRRAASMRRRMSRGAHRARPGGPAWRAGILGSAQNRCSSRPGSRRPTCGEARSRCMRSSTHPSRSRQAAPSASSANQARESRRSPA